MEKINLKINGKVYVVNVAETEEDFSNGLQGITSMPENEGMLFPFDEMVEVTFVMKDTAIPLDIIFIDDEEEVTKIFQATPESQEEFTGKAKYVLELNIDSSVKVGDEIEFDEDLDDIEINKMHVIGSDGSTQMEIVGGERIFSRKNTKTLIKMAKRAYKHKTDRYYKALGKKVFEYLDTQDSNEEEFVELP